MILSPGRNCWRVEKAERFRCVQDGAEFFRLVREAILKAKRSIFIVGWDIAAGVDLLPGESEAPGGSDTKEPTRLAALLDFVTRRRRQLHCYVLIWDYSAVYALERDPFSRWKLGWRTHRRVHFRYDSYHPLGSSHHQKIVVVDDRLAFSGGLDLTAHRWDTAEHPPEHPLRKNLLGQPYEPFHDIQAMVEGPVAARLGELARARWRRRTRVRVPPIEPSPESLWPEGVEPDLVDVDVAIARTDPGFRRVGAARECEALYLDSIAAARKTIYIENQYFTNRRMADALAARLAEKDGPEVVVVGPKECSGWLEQKTMGALRHAVYERLREADAHGRLRLYLSVASREKEVCIFIHSKVMVVDDELLRIGSANLSNRSMGMDTECDLLVVVQDAAARGRISHVRDRLLSEHLGIPAEEIGRTVREKGSLRAALDALDGGDRGLVPIRMDTAVSEPPEAVRAAADPNEPMLVTRTIDRLLPDIEAGERRRGLLVLPVAALLVVVLLAWRFTGTAPWKSLSDLRDLLGEASWNPDLVVGTLVAFAIGGMFLVPSELLVLATVVLLGPLQGGALALLGALASAAAGYAIGRALGPERLVPWVGRRAFRLWRELRGSGGGTSVALLRLVSISSATTVHLLSGAARVSAREYWIGTLVGFLPGFLALCLLGGLLRRMILHPHPANVALAAFTAIALAFLVLRSRQMLLLRRLGPSMQDQMERARYG